MIVMMILIMIDNDQEHRHYHMFSVKEETISVFLEFFPQFFLSRICVVAFVPRVYSVATKKCVFTSVAATFVFSGSSGSNQKPQIPDAQSAFCSPSV